MYSFCVFAGTTEGRELAEFLCWRENVSITVCLATEYGESLLAPAENLTVRTGRMTRAEMSELLESTPFELVIDATHPYAAEVTENIAAACAGAGREYMRLLREDSKVPKDTVFVPDAAGAADFLDSHPGNILLTTGSKDLEIYSGIAGFSERVWARVLPMEASLESCRSAGLPPSHIIAMQGPFHEEMNLATLRAVRARYLVTKESGAAGGFDAKAAAAQKAAAALVVIGRPEQREGYRFEEILALIGTRFGLNARPEVTVAGIGPGGQGGITVEAASAIDAADCLIGARRMLEACGNPRAGRYAAVAPEEIAGYISAHPEYRRFAVVMSGDTGFFSGAKKLLPLLRRSGCKVKVLPGLSSLSCLCARLGCSYEDVVCVSLHGRTGDIVPPVRSNRRVFALTGGENSPGELCRRLTEARLGWVQVHIGQRLGYGDEQVVSGTASELSSGSYDSLSAMLIEHDGLDLPVTPGWPDSAFQRGGGENGVVPMTKSEVRSVCLSKLRLTQRAVCWDVGAGTGSVAVEMALLAKDGSVWAVERDADAVELLRQNRERFFAENLHIIPGSSPAACEGLPPPTHVFIGGSGGGLRRILEVILQKNPDARIVATAVTLESVGELTTCLREFGFSETETVSLTVARDRKAGPYHLMTGQNPVYIFTMSGAKAGARKYVV